jgi:tetratricopeptide (TPR) repeat protein
MSATEGWHKIESPHFVVVGDVGPSQLTNVVRTLEQFRLASARLFPSRRVDSDRPTTVVVFEGRDFRPYAPRYKGRAREDVAGYFTQSFDRNFLVMRSDAFGADSFRLVLHEYQHLVTQENIKRPPLWLQEGLSEFYSTFAAEPDGRTYILGRAIGEHMMTLNASGYLKFEELFMVDGGSPVYNEGRRVGIFYAQSWAFVHFCLLGDERKWSEPFARFLVAIVAGQNPNEAFRHEFGPDVAAFERRFRAYSHRLTFPALRFRFDESTLPSRTYERSRLSPEETEYLKARLATDPKVFEERLAKSLLANPTYRPALALRGESSLRSGSWAQAAEYLMSVAQSDPSDARTCGLAMHALNLMSRFQDALQTCAATPGEHHVMIAFERGVALDGLKRPSEAEPYYRAAGLPTSGESDLYSRAWDYLEAGLPLAAARAVGILMPRNDIDPELMTYARFARFLGFAQSGQSADARAELKAIPLDDRASPWAHAVFRFLSGTSDAEALLKLADGKDQQTEARAYVGLVLLGDDRRAEARPHLEWVVEHGNRDFSEYRVVVALLKRQTRSE